MSQVRRLEQIPAAQPVSASDQIAVWQGGRTRVAVVQDIVDAAAVSAAPLVSKQSIGLDLVDNVSDAGKALAGNPVGDAIAASRLVKFDGTGAVNRTVYASVRGRGIPLDAFGIGLDGNIDAAYPQAVAARALALANYGRSEKILFPSGILRASTPIVYDNTTATEPGAIHCHIEGSGSGLTTVVWLGDGTFITYNGGATADFSHSLLKLRGLQVLNNGSATSRAFAINKAAFAYFEDLVSFGFDLHWDLVDVLSTKWNNCRHSGGRRGLWARKGTFSYPNALTFIGHHAGSADEWGIVIDSGSLFTMVGGSVEGCGASSSYSSRGGIVFNQPGLEGQVAATLQGVYFEGNAGTAHVLADHAGASRQALLKIASSFNLVSQATKPVYTIYGKAGASDPTLMIDVAGSGFGHFNDYVPSGANPYLFAQGQARFVGADQAVYQSALQRPTGVLNSFASCAFDGTSATPTNAYGNDFASNVSSITKNGTGDYTLNFRARGVTPYNVSVGFLTPLNMLPPVIFSEDAQSVRLQFRNSAGTLTDANARVRID